MGLNFEISKLLGENIIQLSWFIQDLFTRGDLSYDEVLNFILDEAESFEKDHIDTDWNELDYSKEIKTWCNKALAKKLWEKFEDVPVNPDTEEIEIPWFGFLPGTYREDIWHWFEDQFFISVAEDLMNS